MPDLLTEIITLLVGGISGLSTGLGKGLSELAQSIFLTTTGSGETAVTSLSVFGSLIVIFAGISLAIGLSKFIVNFVTSLGASH